MSQCAEEASKPELKAAPSRAQVVEFQCRVAACQQTKKASAPQPLHPSGMGQLISLEGREAHKLDALPNPFSACPRNVPCCSRGPTKPLRPPCVFEQNCDRISKARPLRFTPVTKRDCIEALTPSRAVVRANPEQFPTLGRRCRAKRTCCSPYSRPDALVMLSLCTKSCKGIHQHWFKLIFALKCAHRLQTEGSNGPADAALAADASPAAAGLLQPEQQ